MTTLLFGLWRVFVVGISAGSVVTGYAQEARPDILVIENKLIDQFFKSVDARAVNWPVENNIFDTQPIDKSVKGVEFSYGVLKVPFSFSHSGWFESLDKIFQSTIVRGCEELTGVKPVLVAQAKKSFFNSQSSAFGDKEQIEVYLSKLVQKNDLGRFLCKTPDGYGFVYDVQFYKSNQVILRVRPYLYSQKLFGDLANDERLQQEQVEKDLTVVRLRRQQQTAENSERLKLFRINIVPGDRVRNKYGGIGMVVEIKRPLSSVQYENFSRMGQSTLWEKIDDLEPF